MAVFKIVSRTAVPVIGNRAIVKGFIGMGGVYDTLGPGFYFSKGFTIEYNDDESVFDKLITFGAVNTTNGQFPNFAYGILVWDLEGLILRCESRDTILEGDAAVPNPYFLPNAGEVPPPIFRRASWLRGASLGFLALSYIELLSIQSNKFLSPRFP